MRKLCLTLAAFFFSLMLVLPVHAAQVYSDGFFQYHAYEGYNSICGYFGSETTVTVPSSIAGRPVARIEAGAFDGCSTIEKLVLPDTIMEIEEGAFSGAKNLKTIEDASGVWDRKNAGIGNGNPGGSGEGSPIGDYEYTEPENDGQAESGKKAPESGETDTGKADESQKDDGENSESKTDSGKKNDRNETEIITDSNNKTEDQSKSGASRLICWIILAAVLVAVAAAVAVVIIRRKRNFS